MFRKRFYFYGRVQGVGFRWVAKRAALSLNMTGWIRNEYDGSVTMEVQGTAAGLRQLLAELQDGRFIKIDDMAVEDRPIEKDERGFRVLY